MNRRRPFALAVLIALAVSVVAPASPALAAPNIQCDGGYSHFIGFQKQAAAGDELTQVQSVMDKQVAPLCLNPVTAPSASSWWIMITKGAPSELNYIQYGFWNCQNWCNQIWPGGGTGGQQHEFYERHNGNWDGLWRVDLGNVANGAYKMNMSLVEGATPRWQFRRDGVLMAEHSDSFRDWTLTGATFQVESESWDIGDQNGGSPANYVHMKKARWGLNGGAAVGVGMGGCFVGPDNPNNWYRCFQYTSTVLNDSVATWTIYR